MNPPNISAVFRAISRWLITLAALFVPVFYLPLTADILEFPKQYLLAALVIPALVCWLLSGMTSNPRRFLIRRTSFDFALLGLLLVTLVSSILSDERMTSVFGDHASFTFSFLSVALYGIMYFLLIQTHDPGQERWLASALIWVVSLLSGLFVVRGLFPNLFLPLGLSTATPFSAFASQFSVAAAAAVVIMLGRVMSKGLSGGVQWLYGMGIALCLAAVTMVGFQVSWILLGVGLFVLLMYAVSKMDELKVMWVSFMMFLFVPVLLFIFIGTPSFLTVQLPIEVTVGQSVSMGMAQGVVTSNVLHFLFGSGPATFPIQFSKYRPADLNGTFAWNVRFDHPNSEAMSLLSGLGVIGSVIILVLLLIGFGLIFPAWVARNTAAFKRGATAGSATVSNEFWGVAAAWVMFTVALFLLPFGTSMWILWFLLTALLALHARTLGGSERMMVFNLKTSPQYGLVMSFVFILAFTGFIALFTVLSRHYSAEVVYARGLDAFVRNDLDGANRLLTQSVQMNGWRPAYRLALAQSYLAQAVTKGALPNADPVMITEYVAQAVNESKLAADISPLRVTTWEQLAMMYAQARVFAPEATQWGISALDQAITLEETNPVLHVLLGNLRLALDEREEARESYQRAIALKPDLIDAHLNLSIVEEMDNDLNAAVAEAEIAVGIQPTNVDALFQLGRLYFNRNGAGDVDRAQTAFQSILSQDPNYSNALFAMGAAAERERKISEAISWYEKVLKLNPDNTDVKKKIQDLRLGVTSAPSLPAPAPSLPTTTNP